MLCGKRAKTLKKCKLNSPKLYGTFFLFGLSFFKYKKTEQPCWIIPLFPGVYTKT